MYFSSKVHDSEGNKMSVPLSGFYVNILQCMVSSINSKQLLDEIFVISGIIKVEVSVI